MYIYIHVYIYTHYTAIIPMLIGICLSSTVGSGFLTALIGPGSFGLLTGEPHGSRIYPENPTWLD